MKRVLILLLAVWSLAAFGAVPQQINYQGYLTDSGGSPLDTVVSMTFQLYTTPTGPAYYWTETQPSCTVSVGEFNVILGSVMSIPDSFATSLTHYLGVTVGNNSEMMPRAQLVSVPFSYRVGTVDGASGGTISGQLNVGRINTNPGQYAFVVGEDNSASGNYSTVCGGGENAAYGDYSAVVGGNQCSASDAGAFMGGGFNNDAEGEGSALVGGGDQTARGDYSFVGGGVYNRAEGNYSSIMGGNTHTASGEAATVAGGWNNNATGQFSVVGGGRYNAARASGTTTSGGEYNAVESNCVFGTIGGGRYNHVRNSYSVIAGGGGPGPADSNSVPGYNSAIGGGGGHWINGQYSAIGGGRSHEISGNYSFIGGGYNNEASGDYATIPGGTDCLASGDYSFAAGRNAWAAGDGSFAWSDCTTDSAVYAGENQFAAKASGGFYFYTDDSSYVGARLLPNASAWIAMSDSTKKTDIRLVDTKAVLDKVAKLSIKEWRYKAQPDPSIRHVGPMAQDFWSAFHLGEDSLGISTVDPDGIALAAIQELAKRCDKLEQQNINLQRQLQSLLADDQQSHLSEEK